LATSACTWSKGKGAIWSGFGLGLGFGFGFGLGLEVGFWLGLGFGFGFGFGVRVRVRGTCSTREMATSVTPSFSRSSSRSKYT